MKRGRPKGRSNDSRSFGPLGDLIRKARLAKQMGLLDVAQSCGCSVQFISNIEHGRAPLPWDKVEILAAALGLQVSDLQAANLAIRSDFKSFVSGSRRKTPSTKRISAAATLGLFQGTASAMASSATDPVLKDLILKYQSATPVMKKKFMKSAFKMLNA